MLKLIPFNYNLIEKGYKPVTRMVQNLVTQLVKFEVLNSYECLYGVVDGDVLSWDKNGLSSRTGEYSYDLLMIPPVTEKWMIVGLGAYNSEFDDLESVKKHFDDWVLRGDMVFLIKVTYQEEKVISVELVN